MNIGIDIDGVITNILDFELDYGSKYFFQKGSLDLMKSKLEKNELFNLDDNDDFWSQAIYEYIKIKPKNFAVEVINKLNFLNNKIYIITNRVSDLSYCDIKEGEMKKIVINWLKDNCIKYDEIIFSSGDKTKYIIDNKIDIMIEDNPKNIKAIAKIIPVICYDAYYNKSCFGNNIIRCYSWYDIFNTILKLKEKRN